jgi:hypothetical protein
MKAKWEMPDITLSIVRNWAGPWLSSMIPVMTMQSMVAGSSGHKSHRFREFINPDHITSMTH